MKILRIETPKTFLRYKKNIEKELNVRLNIGRDNVEVSGDGADEYTAERVIEAMDFGFSFKEARELKEPEYSMQRINIKDITNRGNLRQVRARIIGKEGRALNTLTTLTGCRLKLKGNIVVILGSDSEVKEAVHAIKSLVQGAKHSGVYSRLERKKGLKDFEPAERFIEKKYKYRDLG